MKAGWAKAVGRGWRPLAGVAGLAAVVVWAGGMLARKTAPGRLPAPSGLAVPAGAATATVRAEEAAATIGLAGTVASGERVHLGARMPAMVKSVAAGAGDEVKAGQVLLELDDRELREQLAGAEAGWRRARSEYERTQRLRAAGAATEQALIAAESAFASARAQVERAKVMLTYARVVSPIDGVVADRRVEAGDFAGPGQVLLSVYDPVRMRLEVPVPVRLLGGLPRGREVRLELERPAGTYEGTVTERVGELDPVSRTQLVRVLIDTGGRRVLPGTFGRLRVEAGRRRAVWAPAGAVYRVGQLELVQVVQGERAVRRLVTTGPVRGGEVEILSGLGGGETVLAEPVRGD